MACLFCGCALCDVDADGNVRLPEFLNAALGAEPDQELLLSTHEAERCLVGYDRGHLELIHSRTERWRIADEIAGQDARMHHRRVRHLFGMVESAARSAGAIRLSPAMRHFGRIGPVALFVGAGDRFEIWNPDFAIASGDSELREITEYRLKTHRRRPPRSVTRSAPRNRRTQRRMP